MPSRETYKPIPVSPPTDRRPEAPGSGVVTSIGRGVQIVGQVTASENLIIEGTVDGEVVLPDHGVAIGGSGRVAGDVTARTITVLGEVEGRLTASALIELRPSANVTGRLCCPHLSIEEGALFRGTSDPTGAEAAMAVARPRQPEVVPAGESVATASDPADK